jgi:gliding-associated putative ABC transporter substrate-binding component GldG
LQSEVRDILEEFRAYSRGNVRIEWLDPADDERLAVKVRQLGIPMVQMNIIQRDKAEVMNGYLGMALSYRDNTEVIPVVRDVANLEYDLDSRILKVSQKETRTVAVMTTSGEHSLASDMKFLTNALAEQYRVEEITPDSRNRIRPEVNTLLVVGIKNLSQTDLYNVDQFIMRGGRALFLADAVELGQALTATAIESEAFGMLALYGATINKDLVLDRSNEMASFSSGFVNFFLPYPFWVKVRREGFHQMNPAVNKLESLVLPWTSSIDTGSSGQQTEITVLAASTGSGYAMGGRFNLDPQQPFQPTPGSRTGSLPLVVLLDGTFESYFRDKPAPEPEEESVLSYSETVPLSQPTQVIVVANARFATDRFAAQFPQNMIFLQNAVDWLTLGDYLLQVRSKAIVDRPLNQISERGRTTYKAANTYLVPLLVAIVGVLRLYTRRRRKS